METTYRAEAHRYDTGELVSIAWRGSTILSIQAADQATTGHPVGQLPIVAPGFVDLQINGYVGYEYCRSDLVVDQVMAVHQAIAADGVTTYCPTLTTQSFSVLCRAAATISRACRELEEVNHSVLGIHLEGPYISVEDGPRGAHPKAHCRPPDWDEFLRLQESAEGRIRIVTLSPEYPESCAFIERLVAAGVLVAIGHTAATPEQIDNAVAAGARLSTHLGNGCHLVLPRHPNYIWQQLADDRLTASVIVDGHHLPASVVRCFVRAKTPQRCILVSDVTALGGMPPGRYETSLGAVEILEDGRLVVAGQRKLLAGAARPIGDGVVNVMRFASVDLRTAVDMATVQPARLLDVDRGLKEGAIADMVFFRMPQETHTALTILGTVRAGRIAFDSGENWYRVA